jgi:hypothetical protein
VIGGHPLINGVDLPLPFAGNMLIAGKPVEVVYGYFRVAGAPAGIED